MPRKSPFWGLQKNPKLGPFTRSSRLYYSKVIDSLPHSQPTTTANKNNTVKKPDRDFVGAPPCAKQVWTRLDKRSKKRGQKEVKKLERQLFRPTFPLRSKARRRRQTGYAGCFDRARHRVKGSEIVRVPILVLWLHSQNEAKIGAWTCFGLFTL